MKKPTFSYIPSGKKASKVYSAVPNGLSDMNYVSGSNIPTINENGFIDTLPTNMPNIENHYVNWQNKKNILPYAEKINSNWTLRTGISCLVYDSVGGVYPPKEIKDKKPTLFTLSDLSANPDAYIYTTYDGIFANKQNRLKQNTDYTFSFYAKNISSSDVTPNITPYLVLSGGNSNNAGVIFLNNGKVFREIGNITSVNKRITVLEDGWSRYEITINSENNTGLTVRLYPAFGLLPTVRNEGATGVWIVCGLQLEENTRKAGEFERNFSPKDQEFTCSRLVKSAKPFLHSGYGPYNYNIYSEDFTNAYYTKTLLTVTPNAIISPDGLMNGTKLTELSSSSTFFKFTHDFEDLDFWTWNYSIYAKKGSTSLIELRSTTVNTEALQIRAVFDLDLEQCTFYSSSHFNGFHGCGIHDVGNGWYRLSIYGEMDGGGNEVTQFVDFDTYIGRLGENQEYIYVFGAQLTSYPNTVIPLEYVKTNGTLSFTSSYYAYNGLLNSPLLQSYDATIFLDVEPELYVTNSNISLSENTSANYLFFNFNPLLGTASLQTVVVSNLGYGTITATNIDFTKKHKFCGVFEWENKRMSFYIDGELIGSIKATDFLEAYRRKVIHFARASSANGIFCGRIHRVDFYDYAITDTEARQLTSLKN